MNRHLLIGFILLGLCINSFPQKINNNWAFGNHSGLDFNTDPPSFIPSTGSLADTVPYFVSAISDKYGQLQFYTDGLNLWDKYHQIIQPDNFRWPWYDRAMPLLCPYPNNDSLYYLFAVSTQGYPKQLIYLTLNSKLNYGLGGIVYPNASWSDYFKIMQSNASFLLAGTSHCNQKDYWIVNFASGSFKAFLINSTGVSATPITSVFSSSVLPANFDRGWSNIKFSANSEKMLVCNIDENAIVVFDFNNNSGTLSNPQKIRMPLGKALEDAELSPDGTKLYFGAHEKSDPGLEQHNIFQMDLMAGSVAQIQSTIYKINDRADRAGCTPHDCFFIYRSLVLGPDGKIYVSMREVDSKDQDLYLSVIGSPNKPTAQAQYLRNEIEVHNKYRFLNYNYIRSGSFTFKGNAISFQKKNCKDLPVEFSLLFHNIDSVRWDFGDPTSGSANQSTVLNPQHQYSSTGYFPLTAFIYTKCVIDTAKTFVLITDMPGVHVPDFIRDTTLCLGDQLSVDVSQPNAFKYEWENNMTTPVRTFIDTGTYSIRISNECSSDYKRFHVNYIKCKCNVYIPSAFTPNKDRLNDVFKPSFQCTAKNYEFTIIDRWGGTIYKTNRPNEGWNGIIKDREAPIGIYVWMLKYTDPNTNRLIVENGTVSLLR